MAKASSSVKLEKILKDQQMNIVVTTACASTGKVILRDDKTVYAQFSKGYKEYSQKLLGQAFATYNGGSNLRLEFVDIEHDKVELKHIASYQSIVHPVGNIKGGVYTIAVEDWSDHNYNDYVVTITALNLNRY